MDNNLEQQMIKKLIPFTQEGSDYIDLFYPLVDKIIETEYVRMSIEGQRNIDILASMLDMPWGCSVKSDGDQSFPNSKVTKN